jgi:hypothetical protein
MAEIIKTNLETEILIEEVKTNPSIEYTNCSHLDAVGIELITTFKQVKKNVMNIGILKMQV